MDKSHADIRENEILKRSPELLSLLLKDHTLSTEDQQVNIFWATNNYAELGEGYQYSDKITVEAITDENDGIIKPRALKSRETQRERSREMAEVFTPSWICNKQCNLVDNAWFGRENVFNEEVDNADGTHSWIPEYGKILFPEHKTWIDYVKSNRLEITCGEAPYLVSRYDAVTGKAIPIALRIGFLDRKLRIVNENTSTPEEWLRFARLAFMATYGYEWQGDNILLAREALLYTYIDYYNERFGEDPQVETLIDIAHIISWNIWQMDGLKSVIPLSCKNEKVVIKGLFGDEEKEVCCEGCKKKDMHKHNGIYCKIMDWEEGHPITFISLIKKS